LLRLGLALLLLLGGCDDEVGPTDGGGQDLAVADLSTDAGVPYGLDAGP
jgi:hypothetical protein